MISNIIIVVNIDIVEDPIYVKNDDDDDEVGNDPQLPLCQLLQSPAHPSGGYRSLSRPMVYHLQLEKSLSRASTVSLPPSSPPVCSQYHPSSPMGR